MSTIPSIASQPGRRVSLTTATPGGCGSRLTVVSNATPQPQVYKPFFLASLLTGLTVGVAWGVAMLVQVAWAGRFTGISIHQMNAHGHAQVMGFVGMMILGFAYQAFQRMWATPVVAPRLCFVVFWTLLAGLGLTIGGWLAMPGPLGTTLAVCGGVLEMAALATFATQLVLTRRRSNTPFDVTSLFVFASVALLVAQAIGGTVYAVAMSRAVARGEMLTLISTWQPPLRYVQLHGAILLMILGVGLRMLPRMFSRPLVSERRQAVVFGLVVAAVLAESIGFVLMRTSGNHAHAATVGLAWLGLVAAATVAIASLAPWKRWTDTFGRWDRAPLFVRAAWFWLGVAMLLQLVSPLHRVLSGIDFSHAFYGATRHAFTGGFVTFMMLGFALQVVPSMASLPDRGKLPSAFPAFAVLLAGVVLHVTLQIASDFVPAVHPALVAAGVLELAGIAMVVFPLLKILLRGQASGAAA